MYFVTTSVVVAKDVDTLALPCVVEGKEELELLECAAEEAEGLEVIVVEEIGFDVLDLEGAGVLELVVELD